MLLFAVLMALLLSVCGVEQGRGMEVIIEGPTASVMLRGDSGVSDNGGVSRDASGGSVGGGGDESSTSSIHDQVDVTCEFTHDSRTSNTAIDVVSDAELCSSPNKCIVCVAENSQSGCTISCDGTIPSNPETANDSFNIYFESTSAFKTNAPGIGGVIRFDGKITDWPELMADNSSNGIAFDLTGCSGGSNMKVLDDNPVLNGEDSIDIASPDAWKHAYSIDELDSTPDEDGLGNCVIVQRITASMQLAGADTPGAFVNMLRGSIAIHSQICDSPDTCPTPEEQ